MLASRKTSRFLVGSIISVVLTGLALICVCVYCNQRPGQTCPPLLTLILACCHMVAQLFFLCMAGLYVVESRIPKQEGNQSPDLRHLDR